MVFVAELAASRGLITEQVLRSHREILKAVGLPTSLANIAGSTNWDALYSAIALDKKSRGNSIRFVVLNDIGVCDRIEGVTEEELKATYERVLQ
jgi:3-dehydroquinate synthase